MNGGSASAAEILSGALRDHNFAKLLGEKSFGKGSVQELVDLPGGGAVKVTVAKWVTPGGVNLNHDGLKPDIEVKLTEEDIKAGKDPQLDKAVEEVTK
jgi:carboxyl-terminal processing protease